MLQSAPLKDGGQQQEQQQQRRRQLQTDCSFQIAELELKLATNDELCRRQCWHHCCCRSAGAKRSLFGYLQTMVTKPAGALTYDAIATHSSWWWPQGARRGERDCDIVLDGPEEDDEVLREYAPQVLSDVELINSGEAVSRAELQPVLLLTLSRSAAFNQPQLPCADDGNLAASCLGGA